MASSIGRSEGTGAPKESINQLLRTTTQDVKLYIEEINAQPEDFIHLHLDVLLKSINRASDAAVNYEFKKENLAIDFDATFKVLDDALTFLIKKRDREHIKAMADDSHAELADEMVVAVNAIQNLVGLLSSLRDTLPIHGVDLRDESYKTGKKVESARGKKFKDNKK